jgi:hypothetical protein
MVPTFPETPVGLNPLINIFLPIAEVLVSFRSVGYERKRNEGNYSKRLNQPEAGRERDIPEAKLRSRLKLSMSLAFCNAMLAVVLFPGKAGLVEKVSDSPTPKAFAE